MNPHVPQGATVIQLFPYGWQPPDGSVLREQVYPRHGGGRECDLPALGQRRH